MPNIWLKGLALAKNLLPVSKRWCFISGFCETWPKSCENGVFALPLPNGVVETPDPLSDAFVQLGFRRAQYDFQCTVVVEECAFSAIINCSAQEYKMSSTTNADGVHCEKMEGVAKPTRRFSHGILACRVKNRGGQALRGYG